ncbi:MAG: hypothetical protein U1D30_24055 [Planctomycetota bacterium]
MIEDTIAILRGLKEKYDVHHGVRITDPALIAATPALASIHHRSAIARQGNRPDRRSRQPAFAWKSTACRPSSTSFVARCCSSKSSEALKESDEGSKNGSSTWRASWRISMNSG